jgi:hypothetical protein
VILRRRKWTGNGLAPKRTRSRVEAPKRLLVAGECCRCLVTLPAGSLVLSGDEPNTSRCAVDCGWLETKQGE